MGILDTFRKKDLKESKQASQKDVREKAPTSEKKKISSVDTQSNSPKDSRGMSTTHSRQVVIRPLITEKVTQLNQNNKYVFEVHPDTNKIEIAKEMKRLYSVEPVSVRIINKAGKRVRYGRTIGVTKHWKKAIVTLKKEDRIEVYSG